MPTIAVRSAGYVVGVKLPRVFREFAGIKPINSIDSASPACPQLSL
jgi:hypothetical protein